MFINFWYPAATSEELADTPLKVRMLGQNFGLFRDSSGTAHCLSNVCTHRGGSLAGGRMRGDCVECPYHGWQFNGDGQCTKIPTLGKDSKIPARAKIDSYPIEERYGLVFAFLGDLPEAERPPIMEIKEWGEEGWRSTLQHWVWDIDYKRSIENGIDPAHNEFVHPTHGFSGELDDYQLKEPEMWTDDWGTGIRNKRFAPPLHDEKMREATGRDDNAVNYTATGHHGCAQVWTFIHPTPHTNTKETFVLHDKPIARYREWVADWESRGWRIDCDEVSRTRRKVAYAIPSPARRNSKGWVIDSVPLLPADKSVQQAAE